MPQQTSRLTSAARAELRRRDAQTEAILAQIAQGGSGRPMASHAIRRPGNVDLYGQPEVPNPDGTTSTVDSIGVNIDNLEYLLPTVTTEGRHFANEASAQGVTDIPRAVRDMAVDEFRRTGRHLGAFNSVEEANAAAEKLHDDYARGKYRVRPMPSHTTPSPDAYQGDLNDVLPGGRDAAMRPPTEFEILRGADSAPSLRDILLPRQPEVADPTDAQRAAHEARVRDTQADWGPVRRGMSRAAEFAGEYVPEFLGGALWGDPTDPDASRANLLGQMLTAGVPFAAGLKGLVSRVARPIRAYHGSPHDFPAEPGAPLGRFRSENIGTGEGAQAYGHGLYFAENQGTARSYQGMNEGRRYQVGDRELVSSAGGTTRAMNQSQAEIIAADALDEAFNAQSTSPAQFAANRLRDARRRYPEQAADIDEATGIIAQWQESGLSSNPSGRMYEVNIHANPDDFLDWDAPLSQQSERVQGAVRNLWTKKGGTLEGREFPPFVASSSGDTGDNIHAAIATSYSPVGDNRTAQAVAAQALRGEGIPGIKYLDQGSRGRHNVVLRMPGKADQYSATEFPSVPAANEYAATKRAEGFEAEIMEGTSNWVVFDDSLIEVLKVSGVALPVIEGLRQQAAQNDGAVDITGVL